MIKIRNQQDYIIDTIQDNFSISMQLYYAEDDKNWEKYMNICTYLVDKLKELDTFEGELKPKLINMVYSISQDKKYSVWVV